MVYTSNTQLFALEHLQLHLCKNYDVSKVFSESPFLTITFINNSKVRGVNAQGDLK